MSNGENRTSGPQFRTAPLITSAAMVGASHPGERIAGGRARALLVR